MLFMQCLVQVQWSSLRPTQLPLMCVELATSPSGVSMMGWREFWSAVAHWNSNNCQRIHHPWTHCPLYYHHLSGGNGGQLHQLGNRVPL